MKKVIFNRLQVLCKACHLIKIANEHETGQYIKISDTDSTFNSQVQEVMNSSLRISLMDIYRNMSGQPNGMTKTIS